MIGYRKRFWFFVLYRLLQLPELLFAMITVFFKMTHQSMYFIAIILPNCVAITFF